MCKTLYVIKPIPPSFGSWGADSLSNVQDVWFNNDGAIGVDVLKSPAAALLWKGTAVTAALLQQGFTQTDRYEKPC